MTDAIAKPSDRILVALDTTDAEAARRLALALKDNVGGVKLGKEFFTANGPDGVRRVAEARLPLFLDLKFHDIPNTVAGAVRAAIGLHPFMLNVHASGGRAMMIAAVHAAQEAAAREGVRKPLLLAVTVLTSLGDDDLADVGIRSSAQQQVVRLAKLAQEEGMDGVVCSAREIEALRDACGPHFKLVVPGIRPEWASRDDQKRTLTPRQAVDLGADYLVIGRPITKADDPVAAARRVADELA